MQTAIVIIILVLAVGNAVWHFYKPFRHDADPCRSCEGCPLKGHNCYENHKKSTAAVKSKNII